MEQKERKMGSQEKRGRCTGVLECAAVWIISLLSYLWMSLERGQRWRERSWSFAWAAGKKCVYLKKSCNQEIPNNCRRTSLYTQQGVEHKPVIVPVALKPVAFSPATGGWSLSHISPLIIVHLFLSTDNWDVVECFTWSESFLFPVLDTIG